MWAEKYGSYLTFYSFCFILNNAMPWNISKLRWPRNYVNEQIPMEIIPLLLFFFYLKTSFEGIWIKELHAKAVLLEIVLCSWAPSSMLNSSEVGSWCGFMWAHDPPAGSSISLCYTWSGLTFRKSSMNNPKLFSCILHELLFEISCTAPVVFSFLYPLWKRLPHTHDFECQLGDFCDVDVI